MDIKTISSELKFKAVRSSGSGGQHVNKVASKVELHFNLASSLGLSVEEKQRLISVLKSKLTKDNQLILQCSESRSQHNNKALVIKRCIALIKQSLHVPKKRMATKIPKSVIRKRIKEKRNLSDKKKLRKKPKLS